MKVNVTPGMETTPGTTIPDGRPDVSRSLARLDQSLIEAEATQPASQKDTNSHRFSEVGTRLRRRVARFEGSTTPLASHYERTLDQIRTTIAAAESLLRRRANALRLRILLHYFLIALRWIMVPMIILALGWIVLTLGASLVDMIRERSTEVPSRSGSSTQPPAATQPVGPQ